MRIARKNLAFRMN